MGFTLYNLLKAVLLLTNALAILHPHRFLAAHGLDGAGLADGGGGVKQQVAGLLHATRFMRCAYLRAPPNTDSAHGRAACVRARRRAPPEVVCCYLALFIRPLLLLTQGHLLEQTCYLLSSSFSSADYVLLLAKTLLGETPRHFPRQKAAAPRSPTACCCHRSPTPLRRR
jgi:hypothetical protein